MNIFKKIIYFLKRPSIILVTGKGRSLTAEVIFKVLRQHLKVRKISSNSLPLLKDKNEILIFEADLQNSQFFERFKFLIRKSKMPILVATHIGEIPFDKQFFAGEERDVDEIRKLAKDLPVQGSAILNFDDETIREIENETICPSSTFGFQERASFIASDVNINLEGTNFKINYQGDIVPFWLEGAFGKAQIYSALSAAAVGVIKKLNLIEVSESLRSYHSLPGKMRLIKGIKKSWILDDSHSASLFSMIEALEILGKIKIEGKKIAVLGDVLGIGKYALEAHETIGEKAKENCNLLFTIGLRARFIAQGARNKGMGEENIFQFDRTENGKILLQEKIKQGDLILIDGSKEMKMLEIVNEIKAV